MGKSPKTNGIGEEPVKTSAIAQPAAAPLQSAPVAAAPKKKAPAKKGAGQNGTISQEDIALRAYFISERRRNAGLPGDEAQDWLDAEREIRAEKTKKARAKKTPAIA